MWLKVSFLKLENSYIQEMVAKLERELTSLLTAYLGF